MRKSLLLFVVAIFSFGFISNTYAQCTPDEGCIDIEEPGQLCPLEFVLGYVNVPYEQVVTFIPPNEYNGLEVQNIVINEVTGLPPGLDWAANAEAFPPTVPETKYCGVIFGTPTEAGEFIFDFDATVTVVVFGNPTDIAITAATLDYQPILIILPENQAPPVAEFSADQTTVVGGTNITFTDNSFNAGAWAWSFEGAETTESTDENPTVLYNTAGEYDVTLTVTNTLNDSTDTYIAEDYITITSTVHVTPEFAKSYNVFPNPTTDYFTVTGENIVSMRVLNTLGQVIYENNNTSDRMTVDVSSWSIGWYIIEMNDGNETLRANITVE